jgi:hypothetical protein
MTANPTPIDISNMPDLTRLAEEVQATKKPLKLTRDRKTVAILMPVGTSLPSKKKPEKTRAEYEAFRAAFGSWKDVNTEALLKNIYADRRRTNTRPPVQL